MAFLAENGCKLIHDAAFHATVVVLCALADLCKLELVDAVLEDFVEGEGVKGSRAIKVVSEAKAKEDWDTQFWIVMNDGMWLEDGQKVTFETAEGNRGVQAVNVTVVR